MARGGTREIQIQGVTITVSDLAKAKRFYEGVFGFVPDSYYEPTRWQSYKFEGRAYLGIAEVVDFQRADSSDIINFDVPDVESMWNRVKDKVDVEMELSKTAWGSYKFVIKDLDGYRLGFVGTN